MKSGWEGKYTKFLFGSLWMNLYVLYHELRGLGTDREVPVDKFGELVVRALIAEVVRREGRATYSKGYGKHGRAM